MQKRFYLDTCIWLDFYEDRKGYCNESLGTPVFRFFSLIIKRGDKIIISDIVLDELGTHYLREKLTSMLLPFMKIIEKIKMKKEQFREAIILSKERNVPLGDAMHVVLSRDNNCILVTRDNDFRKLQDIAPYYKPEELV